MDPQTTSIMDHLQDNPSPKAPSILRLLYPPTAVLVVQAMRWPTIPPKREYLLRALPFQLGPRRVNLTVRLLPPPHQHEPANLHLNMNACNYCYPKRISVISACPSPERTYLIPLKGSYFHCVRILSLSDRCSPLLSAKIYIVYKSGG